MYCNFLMEYQKLVYYFSTQTANFVDFAKPLQIDFPLRYKISLTKDEKCYYLANMSKNLNVSRTFLAINNKILNSKWQFHLKSN